MDYCDRLGLQATILDMVLPLVLSGNIIPGQIWPGIAGANIFTLEPIFISKKSKISKQINFW